MGRKFIKFLQGYNSFRDKYAHHDSSIMHQLADHGQKPEIMVVACSDSRVDPALLLQCEPGDLFVVRNVANIIPPYENDEMHHGTSAALEFGICGLNVKHLILLGHSQCGGIHALLHPHSIEKSDFINKWVNLLNIPVSIHDVDQCSQFALHQSKNNCLTFPWISEKVNQQQLKIHLWFFDIKTAQILAYCDEQQQYLPLEKVITSLVAS